MDLPPSDPVSPPKDWTGHRKSLTASVYKAATNVTRREDAPPEEARWVGPILPEDLSQRKTPASLPFPAVRSKTAQPEGISGIEKLALGLLFLLGLGGMAWLGFWLFEPKPVIARVEYIGWARVETLQELQTHRGEGWRDNRENVRWGNCTSRKDGSNRRMWCTYTYQAWETIRTEGLSGNDHEPRWFGLLAVDPDQRVIQEETYRVAFRNTGDSSQTWETHPTASDYMNYHVGQLWETYREREQRIPLRLR